MNVIKALFLFSCVAVDYAVGYTQNITFEITCHELWVQAKWNQTEFGTGNVTGIEWNDPSCNAFEKSDTMIWASTNFSACQSTITENNDTIVQENTVQLHVSYREGIIERQIVYSFNIKCEMSRTIHTPGQSSYQVTERRIFGGNTTATTDFNVRMDIYQDNTFNQILVNTLVSSFDPIFVGIYEVNDNALLRFVAHQCYATPTSNRNDAKSYTFFDGKCPIDNSFKQLSSSPDRYHFQINAFRFIQMSASIYIHCRLSVCRTNSTSEACTQQKSCSKRKRRALGDSSDGPLEEVVVMTQKLTFVKPSCLDKPCPAFSSCVELDPPVCRCGYGYVFNSESNTCSNQRMFTISGISFDVQFEEAFSDPYSKPFIKLAIRMETQLKFYVSQLNDNTIEGLKVIQARKGSVIVDVDVIYKEASTKKDAYKTILKSISKSHTDTVSYDNPLEIKPVEPTMEEEEEEGSSGNSPPATLILAIAVPSAAGVLLAVVAAVCLIRKRKFTV